MYKLRRGDFYWIFVFAAIFYVVFRQSHKIGTSLSDDHGQESDLEAEAEEGR